MRKHDEHATMPFKIAMLVVLMSFGAWLWWYVA